MTHYSLLTKTMSIICKQCGFSISKQTNTNASHLTECPDCGTVIWTGDKKARNTLATIKWSEIKLPAGVSIEHSDEHLVITRRWFHPKQIWGIVLFGVMIFFMFQNGSNWGPNLLFFPPFWILVAVAYYTLTKLFNATTITVTHNLLTVKHGPLPTWGNKQLDPTQIKQLFSQRVVKKSKNSTTITYDVRMVTGHNQQKTLVSGLDTPEQALFLEEKIERYLGIRDKPITGEVNQTDEAYIKAWQAFAAANRLHYFRSKIVDHNRIVGDYRGCPFELIARLKDKKQTVQTRLTLLAQTATPPATETGENPLVLSLLDSVLNPAHANYSAGGWFEVANNGYELTYAEDNLKPNAGYLQFLLEALYNLTQVYPGIVAAGSEAIPALHPVAEDKTHPAQAVAETLIRQIAPTSHHLCPHTDRLLCTRCLTCCTRHEVNISWLNTIHYCGCRVCHQSLNFYKGGTVIAVLDSQMKKDLVEQEAGLRINWLARRELFDFDSVDIVQATDEEVERFCVQIGNDTDPVRKPRYADMRCTVSANGRLSENTMRILQRSFGTVEKDTR